MTVATVTAIINGQTYTLTYNSTSEYWESTITAPAQSSGSNNNGIGPGIGTEAQGKGYYPVSVTAMDDATNETTVNDLTEGALGLACRLKVLEKVLPVGTILSPTEGSYVNTTTPEMQFQAFDSGSGIIPTSGILTIDGGAVIPITLTGSGTTYTASYTPVTPLSNGSHTITFGVRDYDGNNATSVSSTFTIDVLPPELEIFTPTEGFVTNQATINVTGVTSDEHSDVTITITVNGVDQGTVTLDASGNFTKSVSLVSGANTIIVTATDSAGLATSVTRNGTLSTTAPVIEEINIAPNPVDGGQTYVLSVKVTDTE